MTTNFKEGDEGMPSLIRGQWGKVCEQLIYKKRGKPSSLFKLHVTSSVYSDDYFDLRISSGTLYSRFILGSYILAIRPA